MTDSKNIVIKVKYAAPDAATEFQPKMITEWNITRIAGAAAVLLLLLGGAFWWWHGDAGETDSVRDQVAQIEAEAALIEAEARAPAANAPVAEERPATAESAPVAASAPTQPERAAPTPADPPDAGSRVRRATLAYRIIGKEPADLIGSTIRVRKGRPLPVYYFTEIRGKSGQNLFHEWRKNGRVMLRHPITIDAERWRATSQRELDTDDQGAWTVRTVDQKGRVMNQIEFTVSAK